MYFTFKKNNKQTKKPVNRFLQNGASAGIRSLQTFITSVRIAHRPNKIFVVLKLLPSRAFPVDGRSVGSHARKKIG